MPTLPNGSATSLPPVTSRQVKSMSVQLKMFEPTISEASPNATSSPGSASGPTLSDLPDGPTIAPSGLVLARASLSARQAKAAGLMMSGTYGPHGSISSRSADLQLSMVSRLLARTALLGSTLFTLTWKVRVTPSGRPICALRASGRRTSGSGCSSWGTPLGQHANGAPEAFLERKRRSMAKGSQSMGVCLSDLAMQVQAWSLASWSTTQSSDWKDTAGMATTGINPDGTTRTRVDQLPRPAQLVAPWPTPMAGTPAQKGYNEAGNTDAAKVASWATPRSTEAGHSTGNPDQAMDGRSRIEDQVFLVQLTASGETPTGSPAPTEKCGQLNPDFSLWLMGLPEEWGNCAPQETLSALRKRRNSSVRTLTSNDGAKRHE